MTCIYNVLWALTECSVHYIIKYLSEYWYGEKKRVCLAEEWEMKRKKRKTVEVSKTTTSYVHTNVYILCIACNVIEVLYTRKKKSSIAKHWNAFLCAECKTIRYVNKFSVSFPSLLLPIFFNWPFTVPYYEFSESKQP